MEGSKKFQKPNKKNDYLSSIEKIRLYSSEQFDKQIVYISGGGLVFTIGFVNNIVKFDENTNLCLLIFTWTFFALSLVLNLISHKTSIYAMDFELSGNEKLSDRCDKITEYLNIFSLFLVIVAIILFVVFIANNI